MVGGADVQAKVTLDRSSFEAGARRVSKLSDKMVTDLARIGGKAALAGFAAATTATVVLSRGLKKAFDEGGKLSDWAARTGADAGELGIFAEMVRQAGGNAEQTADFINRFQRGLVDLERGLSTQVDAAERAGIAIDDFAGKTTLQKIEVFGRALRNTAEKDLAQVIQAFGGRTGAQLLPAFLDEGAIDRARTSYGGLATVMSENAEKFDRASDILNGSGVKFQQFFSGTASVVVDDLLGGLEKLDQMDFTKVGVNFGKAILPTLERLEKFFAQYAEEVNQTGSTTAPVEARGLGFMAEAGKRLAFPPLLLRGLVDPQGEIGRVNDNVSTNADMFLRNQTIENQEAQMRIQRQQQLEEMGRFTPEAPRGAPPFVRELLEATKETTRAVKDLPDEISRGLSLGRMR